MKSLDQAIARVEAQLRYIPTAVLKQARILALINDQVEAHRTVIQLTDDLGRTVGAVFWPLPGPQQLQLMTQVGPAFATLGFCDETWEHVWDLSPESAFVIPEPFWIGTLTYRFVYGPMDHHHVMVYAYPFRADGYKILVAPMRSRQRLTFGSAELRVLDKICHRFTAELSGVDPIGQLTPRHAVGDEHATELDAQLRPLAPSLFLQALLARFYGEPRTDPEGQALLPAALESDIRRYRETYLGFQQRVEGRFYHAFTKAHRGRALCLVVQSGPNGAYRLDVHEDQSRHERLQRMMAACRALPRDRSAVFSACLVLADGVTDHDEVVRRIRLGALKESSALRIINRARSIVDESQSAGATVFSISRAPA